MIRACYTFIFLFCAISLFAQEEVSQNENKEKPSKYDINIDMVVNEQPHYGGGMKQLVEEINSGISFPQDAIDSKLNATAKVSCRVESDGKLSEVKVIELIGYGIDQQIITILKKKTFVPMKRGGLATSSGIILNIPVLAK